MIPTKLDVIVLAVLAAIGLVFLGLFALMHPGASLPGDLVTIETLVVGVLGGRVMPALATSSTPSTVDPAAGVTVVQ